MRSGYIHPGGGKSWAVGLTGHCWSLRGDIISTSYGLGFNAAGVIPSNGPHERLYAFPLRCLSTVLGMGGWREMPQIISRSIYTSLLHPSRSN